MMCKVLAVSTFMMLLFKEAGAQITSAFTDKATGIEFQRFFGAKTSFAFGIALPENPTTDFIGQISAPMPNGQGWGGISLADDMVGPLLLAAWPVQGPNGSSVISSFRLAKTEDESPPVATGNFSVTTIAAGTIVNDTHMTYTFLCQNCIDSKLGFSASSTSGTFEMGWALAKTAVSDATDPASALPFHNSGFDSFDAQLSLARNSKFGEWAALAGITSNGSATPVPIAAPGTGTSFGDDDDAEDKEEEDVDDDAEEEEEEEDDDKD